MMIRVLTEPFTLAFRFFMPTLITFTIACPLALADISHFYISITCDKLNGDAKITSTNVFEGQPPPAGSILSDDLPSSKISSNGLLVCDLGKRRLITIRGVPSSDQSGIDWIKLYINTRPMHHPIPLTHDIYVSRIPKDYFVSVKECESAPNCLTEELTAPDFDCKRSSSKIDAMICDSNALSAADVALNNAYQSALHVVKDPSELDRNQLLWLKKRTNKCGVAVSSLNKTGYDATLRCMEKLYDYRIKELRELIK